MSHSDSEDDVGLGEVWYEGNPDPFDSSSVSSMIYSFSISYSPTNPPFVGSGVLLMSFWIRFLLDLRIDVDLYPSRGVVPRFLTQILLLLLDLVLMSMVCWSFL